ncbi:MAG: SIR2 family NAD-dependent protein deacylase [bacterium]
MARDLGEMVVPSSLPSHYEAVIRGIHEGRVVPFLGVDANLCGRPANHGWKHDQEDYLPSNRELAEHLSKKFAGPKNNVAADLMHVSQYVAVTAGARQLYDQLHGILDRNYPPTPLHQLLARIPAILRAKHDPAPYPLIVTTNFDDLLETALQAENEQYDVVAYIAEGVHHGKFWHRTPEGGTQLIERPNEYGGQLLKHRPVILKIHGAVDRNSPEHDSFVITEDHYINFLTRTDISNLVPVILAAKLRKSHFLFLGHSLRDWSLRIILHRIWGEQKLNYQSWAIQANPHELDQRLWKQREVDIVDASLDEYVTELSVRIQAQTPTGGGS